MRGLWYRGSGVWVGLGLTAVGVIVYLTGATERLELLGYDAYVRHFSRVPASGAIVHVDIDDESLRRVETWPWPRDLQAEVISILHQLGAARIVADILWSEPTRPEVRGPGLTRYAELEGQHADLGDLSPENLVYPDDELAGAVREAGSVYLAMYDQERTGEPGVLAERIAGPLSEDFGLSAPELAGRLEVPRDEVDKLLASVKRRVAEQRVAAVLEAHPDADAAAVHAATLKTPFDRLTADREDILAAYFRQLGLRGMREKLLAVPEQLRGRLPLTGEPVPPIYTLPAGAAGLGRVTFQPDADGVTRRVPLLMEWDGRLVEQLGFAVARAALDIRLGDLSIDGGELRIAARGQRPAMRVPFDQHGAVLINWQVASAGWQASMTHLPVARVLRLYDARRGIRENAMRRQWAIGRAMRIVKDDAAFEGYRQQVQQMLRLRREQQLARLQGRAVPEQQRRELAALEQAVRTDQQATIQFIREQWTAVQKDPQSRPADIAREVERFREAHRLVDEVVPELERASAAIAVEEQRAAMGLQPIVAGKICLLGYTATAVADMIHTPAYARAPGVIVHSNVLNGFLAGQFRSRTPRFLDAAAMILLGVAVTVTTATRGPRASLIVLLLVVAGALALSALAFARLDRWMPMLTAVALSLLVWPMVLLVRYLVTDRQRRQFGKALAQYVSPAVARRIAESAKTLDLAPASGVVSCFFSDLADFTRLSERLGPEGTRAVLNPYLEAVSAALHRRGALINKFMGDGVFAFFNAPVLPCADHAAAACAAALEAHAALRELADGSDGAGRRGLPAPLADEFRALRMRVGIATGPAFIGDYGSENKLDYTCVGDTVNLASRLEGAAKLFGCATLVAGGTREAAGREFVFRTLGRIVVKGQTIPVPVYELLGRVEQTDGIPYAELFESAVDAFARREWAVAVSRFEECLRVRPADAAARLYLGLIQQYRDTPPPESWQGSILLAEK